MTGYYRRANPPLRARALRAYAAFETEAKDWDELPPYAQPRMTRVQQLVALGAPDLIIEGAIRQLWLAIAWMREGHATHPHHPENDPGQPKQRSQHP